LYDEIIEVANRPRIKKRIDDKVLEEFQLTYPFMVEHITLHSKVYVSPDPDDNYLLELSKDGKADYLITSDKPDLLDLSIFEKTKILSFNQFCKLHDIV